MISIIIPVFKSGAILEELFARICSVMESLEISFEVIFVNDCRNDFSWEIIKKLKAVNSQVRGILLSKNYGQHNALLCGIVNSNGHFIVTMDDDLQNPPEAIPLLLKKINEGYDVVYGIPINARHNFWRKFSSGITKIILNKFMGVFFAKQISSFRIFDSCLKNSFINYRNSTVNIDVFLNWVTNNFSFVEVEHLPRIHGKSGYNFIKLAKHSFDMITGFSVVPLRIASLMGLSFSIFGFLILFFLLAQWFHVGSSVPGFLFIASLITIFSGAQLLAIGVIGEYLSRIFFRTLDKPPYFIHQEI